MEAATSCIIFHLQVKPFYKQVNDGKSSEALAIDLYSSSFSKAFDVSSCSRTQIFDIKCSSTDNK